MSDRESQCPPTSFLTHVRQLYVEHFMYVQNVLIGA